MKKIFILILGVLFLGTIYFQLTKPTGQKNEQRFVGLQNSKNFIVGSTIDNTVVYASFSKPEEWLPLDDISQTGITPQIQTTQNSDYILYGKKNESVLIDLTTHTKTTIPYPYDNLVLENNGPRLLVIEDTKNSQHIALSILENSKKEEIITIPKPNEQENISVVWGGDNSLWYGISTFVDDGGGNEIISDNNIFHQIDIGTKKITRTIKKVKALAPSPYSNDLLITKAHGASTQVYLEHSNTQKLITTFENMKQKLFCDFENETTILCHGYNYSLNQLFLVTLFDTNSGDIQYSRTYDEKKLFPSSYTVDQTTHTLYLLDLLQNGKLYKEIIKNP